MSSVLPWKEEPVSPLSYEEASLLEETFYQSSLDVKFETDLLACETKAEVASHILENLESLMDLDDLIKDEEPFLLDEKILPILDEVEAPRAVAVAVPNKMEYFKPPDNTHYLLNDFESIYGTVQPSYLNNVTLTPPQSPPSESPLLTTLEPILQSATYPMSEIKTTTLYSASEKQLTSGELMYPSGPVNISIEYSHFANPQPDIAHELAVVDELVRTRVEDMQWSNGPSSPDSSSSSNSNFGDCSSDDPEWAPETISSAEPVTPPKSSRKRSKPYSRAVPEDKKSRKKEQNKNAATRYRLKKKAEVEEILTEEKGLLDKNKDLNESITDLQREIKYIKGLMRDLFKAKGLIN